jgi:group II intron reverse transcriptase/maturase
MALETFWQKAMAMRGGWVVEVDIRKFFDTMIHRHLMDALQRRVRDGVLLRLISKWLHAGVQEDGGVSYPDAGSPQGGVISPILSNIYLHEVLDTWFEREVKPRLRGKAHLLRYADDAVLLFGVEEDARRVMAVLPKRFGKYGLSLHPEKTRMVTFRRPSNSPPKRGAAVVRPGTFDLLGFTHHWSKSRWGNWAIQRRTAKDRFSRALKRVGEWCMQHRHDKVDSQQRALARKLRGHYEYYGIAGNSECIVRFHREVIRVWRKGLSRRSQRAWISFERMNRMLERYPLPPPHIAHPLRHAANP